MNTRSRIHAATLVAAVALCASYAVAAPYEIKISDGRPDAMYRLGETCRFRLTARDMATNDVSRGGVVKVKVDNFGDRVFATREWYPASEPVLEMTGTMDEPGFLRVVAMSAPRKTGALWALGKGNACWSVGFEPERIKPGSARPADFDAYWDGEKARLAREVPPDFRRERVDQLCNGAFEVWKVSCATFGGKRTWGFLVEPKDLSSGRLPLHVNVPGAGPALSEAGTRQFMKAGEIHLIVNVHPYEPAKDVAGQKRLYDAQDRECAKKYGCNYAIAGGAVSREEFFFHDALLGIDRTVAWAVSLPEVDRTRVRYSGGSQGGGMGIALCALNPAIGRAVFMVPALADLCGFRAGRQSGWPLLVERQKTSAAKSAAEAIAPYFDAAHFAPRVKIPLRVEAGLSDTTCPPPCVYAAFNAFGSSDKKAANSIGCGHGGSKENRSALADWLRGGTADMGCKGRHGAEIMSPESALARPAPSPALAARLAEGPEIYGIVHWGLNTYTDREWGFGDEDPAMLNPDKFDADQIVGACKAGGLGGLVVVAKHHDGFCLWPTKTTDHNVRRSPFGSNGRGGNYVKEMEQACRRAGLKFGVYVSPWDRNNAAYGTERYVEIYHAQIKELLSGDYGEIFEMWFDGANGGDGWYGGAKEVRKIPSGYYRFGEVFRFVRALQPGITIFAGEDDTSDFRWPGNERGVLDPDSRATVCTVGGFVDGTYGNPGYKEQIGVGSPTGRFFRVCEADFPLRRGWFYHEKERGTTKSAAYLTKLYLSSVGNGGTMNIGIAPDKSGRLDADDVRALAGFGVMRRALFAHEAKGGGPFNVVVMHEDVSVGEQVDEWEFVADGKAVLHGKSVGWKRIRALESPCIAKNCELKVLKGGDVQKGVSFKLYNADLELVKAILSATGDDRETDTAKWMTGAQM